MKFSSPVLKCHQIRSYEFLEKNCIKQEFGSFKKKCEICTRKRTLIGSSLHERASIETKNINKYKFTPKCAKDMRRFGTIALT